MDELDVISAELLRIRARKYARDHGWTGELGPDVLPHVIAALRAHHALRAAQSRLPWDESNCDPARWRHLTVPRGSSVTAWGAGGGSGGGGGGGGGGGSSYSVGSTSWSIGGAG